MDTKESNLDQNILNDNKPHVTKMSVVHALTGRNDRFDDEQILKSTLIKANMNKDIQQIDQL